MSLFDYIPVIIQIILALGISLSVIIVSHLFGQRGFANKTQDLPYECGLFTGASEAPRFAVKFYVTAMLFILFDIEAVFLLPWTVIYREFLAADIPVLMPALFFISVLVIGLFYELKNGALEWETSSGSKD